MLLTISIVSHGHGQTVKLLLEDLSAYTGENSLFIILTLNSPELETIPTHELRRSSSWPIRIVENILPKGFGANHNSALRSANPGIWCVINPDLRVTDLDLISTFSLNGKLIGLVYPQQISPSGEKLDYVRELVTPWSLLKRYLVRLPERPARPDWVSGCFMAFRSEVYQQLRGFNEKYFLYCEDVDICLRLQLAGYTMAEADFSVVHDTRRGTLKKFEHFKWHVTSLLRLWLSKSFWAYLLTRR